MKRICLTASLLLCGILSAQTPLKTYTASDVNQNNTVDVEDVTQVVNSTMGKTAESNVVDAAELNEVLQNIYQKLERLEYLEQKMANLDKIEAIEAQLSLIETKLGIEEPLHLDNWNSTNHEDRTSDSFTYNFTIDTYCELSFDWMVSSENECDFLNVTLDESIILNESGEAQGRKIMIVKPESHNIVVTYTKDKSDFAGTDEGKIFNIQVLPFDFNGHEFVDLGLPSGKLWATCNIGASVPEDFGYYFAWGETRGYGKDLSDGHSFNWKEYKWGDDWNKLTKYCSDSDFGMVDNKTILDLEDDAAHVNWGGSWRMPTEDELNELFAYVNVDPSSISMNGISGLLLKSKTNSNTIFLPRAGCRGDNVLWEEQNIGFLWTCQDRKPDAFGDVPGPVDRYFGCSIRPICSSPQL